MLLYGFSDWFTALVYNFWQPSLQRNPKGKSKETQPPNHLDISEMKTFCVENVRIEWFYLFKSVVSIFDGETLIWVQHGFRLAAEL